MTWSRFDDRTRRHPKIAAAGNEAASFWMWAILHSNEYGLDGFIAEDVLQNIPPIPIAQKRAKELAEKCVSAVVKPGGVGLFEKVDGGYRVHDIEDFQPTAEESVQNRSKRAAAGRAGGIKSGESRRRSKEANNEALASHNEAIDEANNEALASRKHPNASSKNEAKTNPVPIPSREEDPPIVPPPVEGVRETARRAFGEGIRTILAGPPFTLLDDEADVLMRVIADDPRWSSLRGEQLAQVIRKSAADYARDRGQDAKFERGLSPTKWAEWRRSNPDTGLRRVESHVQKSNAVQEELLRRHGGAKR